ncbi:MAG: TetR/AcrR family transcriptional regulator [Rubrivivax sp.]|nr:TetR/AcrR family transcriptional regulator [Rubrivivax sp.]
MAQALRHRGYHGIGLNELLAEARAPKGVLYHHFPGGKSELAAAAIAWTLAQLLQSLDGLIARRAPPLPALRKWLAAAQEQLQASGFERGCPLATVALESTGEDRLLRQTLADAFAQLRGKLAQLLAADGRVPAARAQALAALIVATYEGALMQARVAGDAAPMSDGVQALLQLLEAQLSADAPSCGSTSQPDRP